MDIAAAIRKPAGTKRTAVIDIHSHILPCMDDGSRSVEESLQMLRALKEQGIVSVAATPHFYGMKDSPQSFLQRRGEAAAALRQAMEPELPQLLLGAEVYYFDGITGAQDLDLLKLENTGYLLLEMPFFPWTERMLHDILTLQSRNDTSVILAHVERYFPYQKKSVWAALCAEGVQMQCNAEAFLNWRTKRRALRMLHGGAVRFLGSDCHNMMARPPRMGEAAAVIEKALGADFLKQLEAEPAAEFAR